MTHLEAIKATKGRIFGVTFRKQNGTLRHMVCRTGVRKNLSGTGRSWDPMERGYVTVYDLRVEGYRLVNLNTIRGSIRCGSITRMPMNVLRNYFGLLNLR